MPGRKLKSTCGRGCYDASTKEEQDAYDALTEKVNQYKSLSTEKKRKFSLGKLICPFKLCDSNLTHTTPYTTKGEFIRHHDSHEFRTKAHSRHYISPALRVAAILDLEDDWSISEVSEFYDIPIITVRSYHTKAKRAKWLAVDFDVEEVEDLRQQGSTAEQRLAAHERQKAARETRIKEEKAAATKELKIAKAQTKAVQRGRSSLTPKLPALAPKIKPSAPVVAASSSAVSTTASHSRSRYSLRSRSSRQQANPDEGEQESESEIDDEGREQSVRDEDDTPRKKRRLG